MQLNPLKNNDLVMKKYITKQEYIDSVDKNLTGDEYLLRESKRKNLQWAALVRAQDFKCCYCDTDIRLIQTLICNKVIGLRKRGLWGYSGLHLELEHKNADNQDNEISNLAAACYYCNNDKSDTISYEVYCKYFGPKRKEIFNHLINAKKLDVSELFVYHRSVQSKK
jgi:hypothetical protein